MDHLLVKRCAALALACLLLAHAALAATPLLRCHVTYAGSTHILEARPVADPYPVESVDIGGRFRFKAVVVGSAAALDYITLYAYLDTHRQPVLLQQATYLPPFQLNTQPTLLTGEQHLFGGPVERELLYHCTLQQEQP